MMPSLQLNWIHSHLKCYAAVQLSDHLLANTQTPTELVVIDAKPATTNCLEVKPSFTLDVVGHLFMRREAMMR
jgi:hypothetical protein